MYPWGLSPKLEFYLPPGNYRHNYCFQYLLHLTFYLQMRDHFILKTFFKKFINLSI